MSLPRQCLLALDGYQLSMDYPNRVARDKAGGNPSGGAVIPGANRPLSPIIN